MTITSTQLWQRIANSKLATPADCRIWAGELAAEAGMEGIIEPGAVLAFLIRSRRMTPFQANGLMENPPKVLVFGPYRVVADVKEGIFANWLEASSQPSPSNGSKLALPSKIGTYLFVLDEQKLQANPSWLHHPPSLSMARKQAEVRSPYLLNFEAPIASNGSLAVVAQGQSLSKLPIAPVPWRLATSWIERIAEGLHAMHQAGLVHGRIHSHNVGLLPSTDPCLLRDPLFPPSSPLVGSTPSSMGEFPAPKRTKEIAYAAPEFLVPGQIPSIATDLYALGCLWFEWLTGKPPFDALSTDRCMSSHVRDPLVIPPSLELPERTQRSLLHLCAKNPKARFASATDFLEALRDEPRLKTAPVPKTIPKQVPGEKTKGIPVQPLPSVAPVTKPAQSVVPPRAAPSPPALASPPIEVHRAATIEVVAAIVPPQVASTNASSTNAKSANATSSSPSPPSVSTTIASTAKVKTTNLESMSGPPPVAVTKSAAPPNPSSTIKRPTASSPRRRNKKGTRPKWLMPVVSGLSFFGILALVVVLSRGKPTSRSDRNDVNRGNTGGVNAEGTSAEKKPDVRDPLADQFNLQADDGQLVWAPPRPASPHRLEMLPPGAQVMVFVRPERWSATRTGRAILELLDEPLSEAWKGWQAATSIPFAEAKEVTIGFYNSDTGWPAMAFRVDLQKPKTFGELKSLWGTLTVKKSQDGATLTGPDRSYFVMQPNPLDSDIVTQFVFGPAKLIDEAAELGGSGGPLRRQLEALWQVSDSESDLGLLMAPSYLFNEGKQVLQKHAPRFEKSLRKLFGPDVVGAYASFTLEPNFYGELRTMGASEKETMRSAKEIQEHFQTLADEAESMLVSEPAHPYWRAIANRLPQMLRTLKQYQRYGNEQGQSITNFYLPADAAPNLALAAFMSMRDGATGSSQAPTLPSATVSPKNVLSVDEILAKPIDLVFDQQALETAMNSIAEEINSGISVETDRLRIEIDGGAFEKEGITRNKEVRNFQFRQQPGRDALNDLVRKANPDSVPSLNVDSQKVVWVIVDSAGKKKIQITTRKAALGAKMTLPKEFVP